MMTDQLVMAFRQRPVFSVLPAVRGDAGESGEGAVTMNDQTVG